MKVIHHPGNLLPKYSHFFSKKSFLRAVYFTGTLVYFTAGLCCHAQAQRSEVPKHFGEISPAKFPNTTDSLGIPKGGLKIGDSIPEALWHLPLQVVNHPEGKDTITLNDYRDKKVIILDFWATWCKPCIVSIDKYEALQKTFSNDVALITLHMDNPRKALPFAQKRKWESPVVVGNECDILNSYFYKQKNYGVIWIKGQTLFAIPTSNMATENILEKIIKGTAFTIEINKVATY